MCSTIFSHDTAGSVPLAIASRVMRAVSSVEHASSPLQVFDILSREATTPPDFSLARRFSSDRKLTS